MGVALGCRGDVTIAVSDSFGVDQYAVQMAALATKPGGTVIMVVGDETTEPRSFSDVIMETNTKKN